MQILTEIAFAVLHQTHQAVGTRHGIEVVVKIVSVGQVTAMRVGEGDGFEQASWDAWAGLVGCLEIIFIVLVLFFTNIM